MSSDEKTYVDTADGVPHGTQLNGIYEIDQRIATGGMGEVYRGHNIQTGDIVAIKIVLPEFAKDETILALFRKEASVLNHLSHDAIVRYHVFTVDPGVGRPYLAMEYVDGQSVADRIKEGPMPLKDAKKMVAGVASGLHAAHEAGVIHRDLSPDNIILVDKKGKKKAKIIDFGIAKSSGVGGETLLGGKFAGKYNFVSPEQLGLFEGDVTERSDIYSLGLVFAAALRGEPLDMSGSQVDVIEKRRVVPDISGIDPEVRPIVESMLQPDPANRPEDMATIVEWLFPTERTSRPPTETIIAPVSTPPTPMASHPPVEQASQPPGSMPPGGMPTAKPAAGQRASHEPASGKYGARQHTTDEPAAGEPAATQCCAFIIAGRRSRCGFAEHTPDGQPAAGTIFRAALFAADTASTATAGCRGLNANGWEKISWRPYRQPAGRLSHCRWRRCLFQRSAGRFPAEAADRTGQGAGA